MGDRVTSIDRFNLHASPFDGRLSIVCSSVETDRWDRSRAIETFAIEWDSAEGESTVTTTLGSSSDFPCESSARAVAGAARCSDAAGYCSSGERFSDGHERDEVDRDWWAM